jgi:hypothetical protein
MGLLSTLGGLAGNFFFPGVGGAVGGALGGLLEESSGGGASGAASSASNAANAAAQQDIDLRRRMYEEDVARRQPFYQAGVNALPGYVSGIAPGGELVRGFTQADYQADPGYAFRLSEGMKQLGAGARASGGAVSGRTMMGAQNYAQGLASQEYGNAYNRFRDTQGLRRNALAGVVGFAPTAAGSMASSGQSYAAGAGPQMYQQGVNTGNALIAGQQARQSAYGDVGSAVGKYLTGGSFSNPFSSGSQTPYYGASGTSGGYQ